MILGVHHIAVSVLDDAISTWLSPVIASVQDGWAICQNVYVRHELIEEPISAERRARAVNAPGLAHICLQSPEIDIGLKFGLQAGLTPLSGPVDLGTDFRYLYAHTADGILLELEGAPFARLAAPPSWVGHVAYVSRDIMALVEFYGRALGLQPSARSRLRPNPLFDKVTGLSGVDLSAMWLPGLNVGLEFWQYHNPPSPQSHDVTSAGFTHVCFESDDFDADCARVLASGARRLEGDENLLPNSHYARFTDPEGNRFDMVAFADRNSPMSLLKLPFPKILDYIAAQRPSTRQG